MNRKTGKKITKKRSAGILFTALLALLLLAGCGAEAGDGEVGEGETRIIEHEQGTAEVVENPERVIAFDYGAIDTLRALEVDIIGLPKSNVPAHLSEYDDEKYEDVGTLFEPDFEKIYEMKPDLILISGRQSEVYEELEEIAPTVFVGVDQTNFIESFRENVTLIASLFQKDAQGEEEIKEVEEMVSSLREIGERMDEEVLILMANDGSLNVYGEGSRFGVIHSEFGLKAADDGIEVANHGQNVSFEYLVDVDPDYLLVIDRAAITGGSISAEQTLENEMIYGMQAYEKDRIIYLNSELWYVVTGGIDSMKEMITQLHEALE